MRRSAFLIFNPVAGTRDPVDDLMLIQSMLAPEIDLEIHLTSPETDADLLADMAIKKGVDTIIACGGDGTLSAAATAVIGTDIPLGIISRGTANAFATALNIPTGLEDACKTILQGFCRTVDTARCNQQPMVLLAGIGFEAETVERADRQSKKRFGMMAYVLAGLQQLRDLKSFEVQIETEDKIIKTSASAVTIANAAPPTSVLAQGPAGILVDDGLLDLTIVAPANIAGALAATYHLFQTASAGNPVDRNDIGYLRAKQFKISTDPAQKVVFDGEMLGLTPVEIDCVPSSLRIYAPQLGPVVPTERLEGLPNLVIEYKQDPGE